MIERLELRVFYDIYEGIYNFFNVAEALVLLAYGDEARNSGDGSDSEFEVVGNIEDYSCF